MTKTDPGPFRHIGVIGGGAWGTALAQAMRAANLQTTLWAREPEVVNAVNDRHENTVYLQGQPLDPAVKATNALDDLAECDAWLMVAPTQHMREIAGQLPAKPAPIVIASKGIEQKTLALPAAIIESARPQNPIAILSGPTFAREVAEGKPAALTLACADKTLGAQLASAISSRAFRPYQSGDIVGAQIGGAVKNVLAIACGIATGCAMGENARAALITRGLAELMRLALALGAQRETLMGLSGLGDLILTCSSTQSRNMSLGCALGQGVPLSGILAGRNSVAEGVYTAAAANQLAQRRGIEMPIVAAVDAILNQKASVALTIEALLARPLKAESA